MESSVPIPIPVPELLWKIGGPASVERNSEAALVAPAAVPQLPEETGRGIAPSVELYPPTTSSPPRYHTSLDTQQTNVKAVAVPHNVPLPPPTSATEIRNLSSPPRALIQLPHMSPPHLISAEQVTDMQQQLLLRSQQTTAAVTSGLTAAQQQLRQQQQQQAATTTTTGTKFQPAHLTAQRFVPTGRKTSSAVLATRRSSSQGPTRSGSGTQRRSGSTGATKRRPTQKGEDVVQQSTARLAVSHTARSYALEKQNIINKHEEVITTMKAAHKEEVRALKKTIAKMHSDYAMRRSEEVGGLQDEITRLTEALQENELRIVEAMQEKEDVMSSLKQSNERIKTLDALRADDKHRVIATIENWKQHFEKAEADTRLENASLKDQLLENTTRLVSIDHLQGQLQETERSLIDTNMQLDSCKTQLQHSTSRCRENEVNIGSLTRQIEVLTQENEALVSVKNTSTADKNALVQAQAVKQQLQEKLLVSQQQLNSSKANETELHERIKHQQLQHQQQLQQLQQQRNESHTLNELIESAENAEVVSPVTGTDLTPEVITTSNENEDVMATAGPNTSNVDEVTPTAAPQQSECERLLSEAREMEKCAMDLRALQDVQDTSPKECSAAIQERIDIERTAALKTLQEAQDRAESVENELAAEVAIEQEGQSMLFTSQGARETEIELQDDNKRPASLSPGTKEQEQELLIQESDERERRVAHLRTISPAPAPSAARCIPPTAPSPPGAGSIVSTLY